MALAQHLQSSMGTLAVLLPFNMLGCFFSSRRRRFAALLTRVFFLIRHSHQMRFVLFSLPFSSE
jgi:hypothetical protein